MLEARVCGIPCQVEIVNAHYVKPQSHNPYNCDSDMDHRGYWVNIIYDLYDRRGYRAKWLENKMTPKDHVDLWLFIIENIEPEDY